MDRPGHEVTELLGVGVVHPWLEVRETESVEFWVVEVVIVIVVNPRAVVGIGHHGWGGEGDRDLMLGNEEVGGERCP